MKTNLLVMALFIFGTSIYAGTHNESGFVITNHDTTICKNIFMGLSDAKVEMINGSTMNISKNEILAFKSNGRYYERKEVYLNNKASGIYSFMELLGQRNGLKLFCYRFSDEVNSGKENSKSMGYKDPVLLVIYKDNNFYLQLTKSNTPALLDFFHIDGSIFE
jgi:hypothetical protein